MGNLRREIKFSVPAEKTWSVLEDLEKSPEWVDGVKACKITSLERSGKNVSWEEKAVFGTQTIDAAHRFLCYEPYAKAVIRTDLPMGGVMTRTLTFKSSPRTTTLFYEASWDLGIVTALLGEEKVQNILEDSTDKTLASWKKRVEQL